MVFIPINGRINEHEEYCAIGHWMAYWILLGDEHCYFSLQNINLFSICRYLLLTCSFEWPFTSQHTLINMSIKQNIGSHWVLSFFFHQEFHWRMRLKLNEQLRLYRKWIGNTILSAIHRVSFVCITVICTASWFR